MSKEKKKGVSLEYMLQSCHITSFVTAVISGGGVGFGLKNLNVRPHFMALGCALTIFATQTISYQMCSEEAKRYIREQKMREASDETSTIIEAAEADEAAKMKNQSTWK